MHFESHITLLSLLMSFFIRFCKGDCSDGPYFDKFPFTKFEVGKVIQTIFVEDDLRCVLSCSRFPKCLSFNLAAQPKQDGLFECVLLSELVVPSSILLMVSHIYHHYSRRLGMGMCATPRCQNGGICITQLNGYRCLCQQSFFGKQCENKNITCNTNSALGMEDGTILDRQLSASTQYSSAFPPVKGRLNAKGAWAPSSRDATPWFQIDLGTLTKVTGIATQGSPTIAEWISRYSLQYSPDNSAHKDHKGGKIFTGNSDQNTVVRNDVIPAIIARYILVRPKASRGDGAMRMELYGCN